MVTIIKKGTSLLEIRKLIDKALSKNKRKGIMAYAGKLKTEIDPVQYQKKLRNEWE